MHRHSAHAALAGICVAAVTLFSVTAAHSANENQSKGHAYGHHDDLTSDAPAVKARMEMRKLWEDHVMFTRNYVISATSNLPDAQPVLDRLLKNQDDIGNAIRPYYGDAAAQKLS
ncbi:MAG TPA: hypothetical protein VJS69_08410, partial [Candidatus Krumholzibacteria bacterium]|nr:hypothetical protein [Candidatus Krumholzibacteria bacterium]